MPRDPDTVRLLHMLEHARAAVELITSRRREDLDEDRVLSLALVRLLEIIGEAAGRVSPRAQASRPEIPWSQIVGLRNRLIHGYDSVDMDILWQVLVEDLPALIRVLRSDSSLKNRA